jgi:hypothetical protein
MPLPDSEPMRSLPACALYNKSQAKGSAMGIRISCPNGHKLNVKDHLAGKRGICPTCGATFVIPSASEPHAAPPTMMEGEAPALPTHPTSAALAGRSVVIPVVEHVVTAAPTMTPPPTPAPSRSATVSAAAQASPVRQPAAPVAIQPEVRAGAPVEHSSARFMAKRMRSRRNQTTLAIALLIAVVLLGVVLIWVLSRGPEAAVEAAAARTTTVSGIFYFAADANFYSVYEPASAKL